MFTGLKMGRIVIDKVIQHGKSFKDEHQSDLGSNTLKINQISYNYIGICSIKLQLHAF